MGRRVRFFVRRLGQLTATEGDRRRTKAADQRLGSAQLRDGARCFRLLDATREMGKELVPVRFPGEERGDRQNLAGRGYSLSRLAFRQRDSSRMPRADGRIAV